jgi:hypothetical protein
MIILPSRLRLALFKPGQHEQKEAAVSSPSVSSFLRLFASGRGVLVSLLAMFVSRFSVIRVWLSSANAAAGRARSIASAETSKQQTELTKQTVRFWTCPWQSGVKPTRHR